MRIKKLKTIQIYSNGTVNFVYKTCNSGKLLEILENDQKNFALNSKRLKNNQIPFNTYVNYKKTFFKCY
jgi:hypothetical protein